MFKVTFSAGVEEEVPVEVPPDEVPVEVPPDEVPVEVPPEEVPVEEFPPPQATKPSPEAERANKLMTNFLDFM